MLFRWEYPQDYRKGLKDDRSLFERIKKERAYSKEFLQSDFDKLPDYNLLKDIDKASERIIQALSNKEKIMIYGHDDLDGITSTYIIFDYLENIGYQNHFYYIPNRKTDNHGIQQNLIDRLRSEDFSLLITVDGGVSDFEAIDTIVSSGIDVIVTDHHVVQGKIPNAYAVVNPKRDDCKFPFKMIAGVTVAYFLVKKLEDKLKIKASESYIFWVAMGSISDKVPLQGVNRTIIIKALDNWLFFNDLNLRVLYGYLKFTRNTTQKMSVMKTLIKLFSNSQLPDGDNKTLNFLLSSEDQKNAILREFEENLNSQNEVVREAVSFFKSVQISAKDLCYFYFDEDNSIPQDVMGLVASFIVSNYKIPALILKEKNGVIGCEARSTDGLNLVQAFDSCSEHLIQYGGHAKAAGFTANIEEVLPFKKAFTAYSIINEDQINKYKVINIDIVLENNQLNELKNYLETEYHFLQPYGEGNLFPVFLIKNYDLLTNQLNFQELNQESNNNENRADIVIQGSSNGFNLIDYELYIGELNEN